MASVAGKVIKCQKLKGGIMEQWDYGVVLGIGFFFGVFLTVFVFGWVQGNKGAMIVGALFIGLMVLGLVLGQC
ncbi:hypothetical protein ES708_08134 [subsurface metagenome]